MDWQLKCIAFHTLRRAQLGHSTHALLQRFDVRAFDLQQLAMLKQPELARTIVCPTFEPDVREDHRTSNGHSLLRAKRSA